MASLTSSQQAWRARFETGIGFAAPLLDLMLAAGDRVARIVEPDDAWDPPVHPPARRPEPPAAPPA